MHESGNDLLQIWSGDLDAAAELLVYVENGKYTGTELGL